MKLTFCFATINALHRKKQNKTNNKEFAPETVLIPKNTALIVQRMPAQRLRPILPPPVVATVTTTSESIGPFTLPSDKAATVGDGNEQDRIRSLVDEAGERYKSYALMFVLRSTCLCSRFCVVFTYK
jgi:hypothetical protein